MLKRLLISILILVCASSSGYARWDDIPEFDVNAFVAGGEIDKKLELTMGDCMEMALKNNSEIQIKRISPKIEHAKVRTQKGRFDPVLSASGSTENNTELSPMSIYGVPESQTRTGIFNFGYDQTLTLGTQIGVDLYDTRTKSNSQIQEYNPQYDSELVFSLTQPLLKGFGETVNKADYLIAKNNEQISRQEFLNEVMGALTRVQKAYYELQYATEQFTVAETSLERVKSLHTINTEKYAKGLASNVDILESEAEVARFQELFFAAMERRLNAEDELKFVTTIIDEASLWNANIELLDKMAYVEKGVDLMGAVKKAFEHRPDYAAAKFDLNNKAISVVYNRNGSLPTVDLVTSYGLNGLGDSYSKDMAHVGGGKYPDWMAGINVSVPFFNDEGRGKYERAKLEKKQALISFKRLEDSIILEVRQSVRKAEINYEILEASIKNKEAATKNYEAQHERFQAGLVSTHDILSHQERLALAEVGYLRSVVDYNASLLELSKTEGMTLIDNNIAVEE